MRKRSTDLQLKQELFHLLTHSRTVSVSGRNLRAIITRLYECYSVQIITRFLTLGKHFSRKIPNLNNRSDQNVRF